MLNHLKQIHHLSKHQGLYPLLLSTLLAFMLLIGRVYLSGRLTFDFLLWNLILAWIPYVCSFWATHLYKYQVRYRWALLVPSLIWLVFFPNAPYLVTDFLHLVPRHPVPLWYDIGLLSVFAWTGLFLAVFSLQAMQRLLAVATGLLMSWLFVFAVVALSGFGVYLGRFLRWNSWDLVLHPWDILADVAARVVSPWHYLPDFGFSFIFAAFLLICYLTVSSGSAPDRFDI